MLKNEVRVLGIDDVSFDKRKDRTVRVIGVLFRGGKFMDGVISTEVERDGDDATEKISGMINGSKFRKQLKYVFLDGIAVAGFNIIDIELLNRLTGLPVIVVTREFPDIGEIHAILRRLGMEPKIELLKRAGPPISHKKIFFQHKGVPEAEAREMIDLCSTHSYLPEPVRVAHLIGQGLSLGESRGRA